MNEKCLIQEIDNCIDELMYLKETVQGDCERVVENPGDKPATYCRVDGSKQQINDVRRYVHRRLMKVERDMEGWMNQTYASIVHAARVERIKRLEEVK